MCVDLDALVHQVGDLTLVYSRVVCYTGAQRQLRVNEGIKTQSVFYGLSDELWLVLRVQRFFKSAVSATHVY